MFLGSMGHSSLCMERLDEVLSKIGHSIPAILFLDSDVSKADWIELEKAINSLEKQPGILFLGNSKTVDSRVASLESHRMVQVKEPFDPEEIRRKTQSMLKAMGHAVSSSEDGKDPLPSTLHLTPGTLVGFSKEIKQIINIVDRVAGTDVTVLVRGESGTGKELVARRIHDQSKRKDKPYLKVLCPAIPDNLLESELFGYEKGSFTGAFARKPGRFEFANEGTIFLDEIGDIPFSLQSKLLQVLQEGEFARIGGKSDIHVDVRIIAATNKDLEKEVREGTFREDLFYRLNVVNIYLPSLRDRREDIPILVHYFLDWNNRQFNKKVKLSNETIQLFMEYHWPGNVRELKHTLEGIFVLGNEKEVVGQLLSKVKLRQVGFPGQDPGYGGSALGAVNATFERGNDLKNQGYPLVERRKQDRRSKSSALSTMKLDGSNLKLITRDVARKVEEEMIKKVLERTHWNRKEAAKILGISYKALLYKIKFIYKK